MLPPSAAIDWVTYNVIFPNTFTYFEPFMVKNTLDETALDEGLL
jgi:hypothetical protein